jgi:hypothetical protein
MAGFWGHRVSDVYSLLDTGAAFRRFRFLDSVRLAVQSLLDQSEPST